MNQLKFKFGSRLSTIKSFVICFSNVRFFFSKIVSFKKIYKKNYVIKLNENSISNQFNASMPYDTVI